MKTEMWAKAELWNSESQSEENLSGVISAPADSQAVLDAGRGNLIETAAKENNFGSRVLNRLKMGDCSRNRKSYQY